MYPKMLDNIFIFTVFLWILKRCLEMIRVLPPVEGLNHINIEFLECVSPHFWITTLRFRCSPRVNSQRQRINTFQEREYDRKSNCYICVRTQHLDFKTCLFPVDGRQQRTSGLFLLFHVESIKDHVASGRLTLKRRWNRRQKEIRFISKPSAHR